MNAIGIATTVALGIIIGFWLGAPAGFPAQEMIITIVFWSAFAAFLFECYRIAFTAKHPFKR
jgi:hypothetical protein